ncbi:phage portal protein [Microbulbifer sp. OS29]|uniref:Phage portal protein n=1 Tax=Microbulbifer okhotskensis TaxID=2926617 RepID=A0A9X2ES30_9GAMM|nr:phage portal protein [Microbulbifer okhotskensis]MCO1336774.1 phage portal protein [Microbulbifer okhotskensis]
MNTLDSVIGFFAPETALRRVQARRALKVVAAYEAARPSRLRKNPADNRSGDLVADGDVETLRGQARHLEQNHDFACGILTTLVNNTIGPRGIDVEFQPKTREGDIHEGLAQQMNDAHQEWARRPECTRQFSWAKSQRLLCNTWLRDGETLLRHLQGTVPGLKHRTPVPYTIECLEPDFLPVGYNDPSQRIVQGIEKSAWGEAKGFWLYDEHPGASLNWRMKRRRHSADHIEHLKFVRRLHQTRGVSIFAAVMNRLTDIKDYEENERVAAKIASAMVGFIQKGSPDTYDAESYDENGNRTLAISAGAIYDDLRPGESVGTLQSNRPSGLLTPFLETMHRMAAAGTMASFSSISKNYNGTYSAQRQELVEQWANYETLSLEFCAEIVEPVTRRWVQMGLLADAFKVPSDVDPSTLMHVDFITPVMPWINPAHEASADETLLENVLVSPQQTIRRRGKKPDDVIKQTAAWQQKLKASGITPPSKRTAVPAENTESE